MRARLRFVGWWLLVLALVLVPCYGSAEYEDLGAWLRGRSSAIRIVISEEGRMEGQGGQIDFDVSGGVLGEVEEGVERTAWVRVPCSMDLLDVLIALDQDGNRVAHRLRDRDVEVEMHAGVDERLERLIADLARLRWGYEPGRVVQLALIGEFLP